MASDLQTTVQAIWWDNYLSASIITTVIYDYFLTFSDEVNYVWCKPWTSVSMMFVVVRYIGLSAFFCSTLWGTTFGPNTVEVSTTIILVYAWQILIWLATADLVMILRVYAMWNKSKWILSLLLFIYIPQVILSFILTGIHDSKAYYDSIISTFQLKALDVSGCNKTASDNASPTSLATHLFCEILRVTLSVTLLVLAVMQAIKQSVEMFKATKQWQPNKYMQQLVADGGLHFVLYMFFSINLILGNMAVSTTTAAGIISTMIFSLSIVPFIPRFIISVRELYDRDLHNRWEGIDTGFGVVSQHAASTNAVSTFADVDSRQDSEEGQAVEGDSAIRLEVLGNRSDRETRDEAENERAIQVEDRVGQV